MHEALFAAHTKRGPVVSLVTLRDWEEGIGYGTHSDDEAVIRWGRVRIRCLYDGKVENQDAHNA